LWWWWWCGAATGEEHVKGEEVYVRGVEGHWYGGFVLDIVQNWVTHNFWVINRVASLWPIASWTSVSSRIESRVKLIQKYTVDG
jgi:hypothetical protein